MALYEYRVYEAVPGKLPALHRRPDTMIRHGGIDYSVFAATWTVTLTVAVNGSLALVNPRRI